jgi:hypothetical protein
VGLLGNEKRFRMLKKHKSETLWETRENKLVDKIVEVSLQTGKSMGDLVENVEVLSGCMEDLKFALTLGREIALSNRVPDFPTNPGSSQYSVHSLAIAYPDRYQMCCEYLAA